MTKLPLLCWLFRYGGLAVGSPLAGFPLWVYGRSEDPAMLFSTATFYALQALAFLPVVGRYSLARCLAQQLKLPAPAPLPRLQRAKNAHRILQYAHELQTECLIPALKNDAQIPLSARAINQNHLPQ